MKYCCEPFCYALENAGKKGFGIVLTESVGMLRYAIQTRLCDFDQQDKLKEILEIEALKEIGIPLVIQKRITFCPFCGKKLERLMLPGSQQAQELTELHKSYIVK